MCLACVGLSVVDEKALGKGLLSSNPDIKPSTDSSTK
jgi:hypothetical protein